MDKKEIEKHWSVWKMAIQKQWNKLTSGDLYEIDGMWDHLVERLVKRYGWTRETAEKEIANWTPIQRGWEIEEPMDESPETEEEWHARNKEGKKKIHEWPKEKQHEENPPDWKNKKRKAG